MNLKQLPNILSLLRIAMVPLYLMSLYLIKGYSGLMLALIIFIIAGITDYLDGFLARKLNCVTDFGKIIDPLADKLIVSVALISLVINPINVISIYPVIIIIFREIMVTVLRKYMSNRKIYISANFWGKMKTVLQMVGIIVTLLYATGREVFSQLVVYESSIIAGIRIFFWGVVVVTVVSGVTYLIKIER